MKHRLARSQMTLKRGNKEEEETVSFSFLGLKYRFSPKGADSNN